jgi:uncharacterized protein (DUF697 family)
MSLPCSSPGAASALLLAMVAASAAPARAEGEHALSVGVGWATFSAPGVKVGSQVPPAVGPDVGGSLAASFEQAMSDEISLRGELVGAIFHGGNSDKQAATAYAGLVDVGAVFRFDVLKYVPYAIAGVGGVVSGGGPIARGTELVLVLGGGVDVLVSRERSWGVEARLAAFGGDVTVFTLGVRGTARWGFF